MAIIKQPIVDFGWGNIVATESQPLVRRFSAGVQSDNYAGNLILSHYSGVGKFEQYRGIARYYVGSQFEGIPQGYTEAMLNFRVRSPNSAQRLVIAGVKTSQPALLTSGYVFKIAHSYRYTSEVVEVVNTTGNYSVDVKPIIDELISSRNVRGDDAYLDFAFYLMPMQTSGLYADRQSIWFADTNTSPIDPAELYTLDFHVPVHHTLDVDDSESRSQSLANNIVGLGDEVSWHSPETQRDALYDTKRQWNIVSQNHRNVSYDSAAAAFNKSDAYQEDGSFRFGSLDPNNGPAKARFLSHVSSSIYDNPIEMQAEDEITVSFWVKFSPEMMNKYRGVLGNIGYNASYGMAFAASVPSNGESVTLRWFLGHGTGMTQQFYRLNIDLSSDDLNHFYHVCARVKYFDPEESAGDIIGNYPLDYYPLLTVTKDNGDAVLRVDEDTFSHPSVPEGFEAAGLGSTANRTAMHSQWGVSGLANYGYSAIGTVRGYDNRGLIPTNVPFEGYLKDIRMFSRAISPRELTRLSSSPGVQGGIISLDVESSQSSSSVSRARVVLSNLPPRSIESASQCKPVSLAKDNQARPINIEALSEVSSTDVDKGFNLFVDSVSSTSQASSLAIPSVSYGLPVVGSQSASENGSVQLDIDGSANASSVSSKSEAESFHLAVDRLLPGLGEDLWYVPTRDADNVDTSTLTDFSINSNDGQLTNHLGVPRTDLWKSVTGDGGSRAIQVSTQKYCKIPNAVFETSTSSGSVSLWWQHLAQYGGEIFTYNNDGVRLAVAVQRVSPPSGSAYLRVEAIAGVNQNNAVATVTNDIDGLHHYAITFSESGSIQLFIDGEFADSVLFFGSMSQSSGEQLRRLIGTGANAGNFDGLRMYNNKVLSAHEVKWLYDGAGRGGRGVLGPAPLESPGIESKAEVSAANVAIDLRTDSLKSPTQCEQVSLGVGVGLQSEDCQSASECSEVDVIVREFGNDRDPLIIGDRMSQSLERAVLEFSIEDVATRFSVYLNIEVEAVNLDFTARVGRWTSPYPTNYLELQSGTISPDNIEQFSPFVGSMAIDITDMVRECKNEGETLIRVCLMETENFSNKYYQVDNSSAYKPYLSFAPATSADTDSVESQPECESVFIDINLSIDSAESVSQCDPVDMFVRSSRMDLDSAQSQSNANYVDRMALHAPITLDSAESSSELQGDINIQKDCIGYGFKKSFVNEYLPTAENSRPFVGSGWSYDTTNPSGLRSNGDGTPLSVKVCIADGGKLNTEFNFMRGSGVNPGFDSGIRIDVLYYDQGSAELLESLNQQTLSNHEITLPAGEYELVFEPHYSLTSEDRSGQIFLERVELQRLPLEINDAQSSPECEQANVEKNLDAHPIESQSQCEAVAVKLGGFVESGSFESGLNGWTAGSDWRRTKLDAFDGIWSMGGSLRETGVAGADTLTKTFDTSSYGKTEFRFAVKLFSSQANFPALGGISISVNGVLHSEIRAWHNGSDIPLNEWREQFIELEPSSNNLITIKLIQNSRFSSGVGSLLDDAGQKVFFDDFGIRDRPVLADANDAQSIAELSSVNLGIVNIGSSAASIESQAQVSNVDISIPATTDSIQSLVQLQDVALGSDMTLTLGSIETDSELQLVTLSGHSVLGIDSAETKTHLRKFGMDISPPDLEVRSQAEGIHVRANFLEEVDSAQSATSASSFEVVGDFSPLVDSAETVSEASTTGSSGLGSSRRIDLDSAESISQAKQFAVSVTVTINEDDVAVCTPAGVDESVITGVAAEAIRKGDLVTVDGSDQVRLSRADDEELSVYTGFALTNANAGDIVIIIETGDIILGGNNLKPNQLYIVSMKPGRIRHASEIAAGEYLSIVGIALTDSVMRIGTDFASLLLTSASSSGPLNDSVEIDPDEVKMDSSVSEPSASSGSVQESVVEGDVLSRNRAKADASSEVTSSFGGIAVSDAIAGCTVAICIDGDVFVGDGKLVKNQVYAVSREAGKIMLAQEWQAEDYATIAGLAISDSVLRLGAIQKATLVV